DDAAARSADENRLMNTRRRHQIEGVEHFVRRCVVAPCLTILRASAAPEIGAEHAARRGKPRGQGLEILRIARQAGQADGRRSRRQAVAIVAGKKPQSVLRRVKYLTAGRCVHSSLAAVRFIGAYSVEVRPRRSGAMGVRLAAAPAAAAVAGCVLVWERLSPSSAIGAIAPAGRSGDASGTLADAAPSDAGVADGGGAAAGAPLLRRRSSPIRTGSGLPARRLR